jgi:hypothetical protein
MQINLKKIVRTIQFDKTHAYPARILTYHTEHIRTYNVHRVIMYLINLVDSLPFRRVPNVFMNVLVWEHCLLNNQIFDVAELINTIIITIIT